MATRFETSSGQAVLANGGSLVAETTVLPFDDTLKDFNCTGEWINEDKIVPGGQESDGFSLQGHNPEKAGFLASFTAAEAVATRGALLAAAKSVGIGATASGRESRMDRISLLRTGLALNIHVNRAGQFALGKIIGRKGLGGAS